MYVNHLRDIFINDIWLNRYIKLIQANFDNEEYSEKHHILPKSIFPEYEYSSWNIVKLPYRAHFLAHLFLAKGTKNQKLNFAFTKMCEFSKSSWKNSRLYEESKSIWYDYIGRRAEEKQYKLIKKIAMDRDIILKTFNYDKKWYSKSIFECKIHGEFARQNKDFKDGHSCHTCILLNRTYKSNGSNYISNNKNNYIKTKNILEEHIQKIMEKSIRDNLTFLFYDLENKIVIFKEKNTYRSMNYYNFLKKISDTKDDRIKSKIYLLFNNKNYIFDDIIIHGIEPYKIKQTVICECGCTDVLSYHQARQRKSNKCYTCSKSETQLKKWVNKIDRTIKSIMEDKDVVNVEKKGEYYYIEKLDRTIIRKRLNQILI
jgi:hypothetical protein